MSATGGMGGIQGLNDLIGGWLRGGQQSGQVVGQENPEWEFPMGQDRVPDSVRSLLLRADAGPTGINQYLQQELQKNPKLIDEIRSAINMGVLRPKNQAAQNITTGYGGYRAGDMTPLGPLINGMPSGLNENQLNTLANILNTAADYQIELLKQTGYFNGMPTQDAIKQQQELAQGWKDRATNEFIAMETQRSNQATEGLKGEELTNQNIQKMAELFGGQMVTDPATGQSTWAPTEAAQEFATQQSGYLNGQATLTREQQAFQQAKDVAALASNPRNYIEAQMLGNARGGLGGMQPNNQIQQTTFGPATSAGQQFQVPGGANNQLQNWQTMLGNSVAGRGAATSAYGQPGGPPAPNPQAATQPPQTPGSDGTMRAPEATATPEQQAQRQAALGGNLNDPAAWQNWINQANTQWQGAQQGMAGLNGSPAWGNLVSTIQNYQKGGTTPGWQTPQNGQGGAPEPMMFGPFNEQAGQQSISPVNPATGMRFDESTGQYTSAPMPTAQENYARRAALMGQQAQPGAGAQQPQPGQPFNRGQDVASVQNMPIPTSAFSQALLTNRVVPQSGALQNNGGWTTPQALQTGPNAFNPNKVRAQDYLRGRNSEQAGFRAVGSQAGYSDEDLQGIMKNNLPKFNAPGAGKMI